MPSGLTFFLITLAPKKLIRTRRASEGSASEPSLARRVSMCKDAKLSCRGNIVLDHAKLGSLAAEKDEAIESYLFELRRLANDSRWLRLHFLDQGVAWAASCHVDARPTRRFFVPTTSRRFLPSLVKSVRTVPTSLFYDRIARLLRASLEFAFLLLPLLRLPTSHEPPRLRGGILLLSAGITLAPKKLIRTRRASEGSASEPSLARRVSMCKDAKLSCRGNMNAVKISRRRSSGISLVS